uniref:THO complex subunit 7 homolog n=1 Tax=Steinernema glaseri TaxID=37863 RepID=A0A1I8A8C4_9BILA
MEEYMIRKLTADGRGGGDERKFRSLLVLLQSFFKNPTEEMYDQIKSVVHHLDLAMFRMHANQLAADKGKTALQGRLEEIREEKEAFYRNEVIALQRLNQAKKMRLQNSECIGLVKRIEKLPPRKKTQKQLDVVNEELDKLYVKQKKLEEKLKTRRECLTVLKNVFAMFDQFDDDVQAPPTKRAKGLLSGHESKEEKKERRHKNRESDEYRDRHRYEERRERRSHKAGHSSKRKAIDRY